MSRTAEELEHALELAERKAAELQAWVDSADDETERLRQRVEANDAAAVANQQLVERLSELEAVNHSLRHLNGELSAQLGAAARRDKERLEQQLGDARAAGGEARVQELECALEEANEALATLEVQKDAAVDQVKRYVEGDERKDEAASQKVAALEAQLAEKEREAALARTRLEAHEREERKLTAEVGALRERACTAEEKLGRSEREAETLRQEKGALEGRAAEVERKLDEARRWLAQGELETAELERQLDAAKTAHAVSLAAAPPSPPPPPVAPSAPGLSERVEDGPDEEDLEGFSPQRMHRLEALLAAEQLKSSVLERYATTSEVSLRQLEAELEAARAQVLAMAQRLGLAESETLETLARLDAARREAKALSGELSTARAGEPDGEMIDPEDVLDAPLDALDELATQQASAAKEATEALVSEQRARDQLVSDLSWLKAELEKLSHVREDLRARIGAMVQRELKRKGVVAALLQKLRETEVAAAARAGTLRRLHAAVEHAQRAAVRVHTIYFQKQIGSLQRQLEKSQRLPARK